MGSLQYPRLVCIWAALSVGLSCVGSAECMYLPGTCLCAGCAEYGIVCVRSVKIFGCLHVGSSGCGTACMWAVLSVVLLVSGLSEWALSMCGMC